MGAYNYFADNLPALVKGIRFLLMIPGGDRERGLAQLEEAARSSRLFGTEALMLLAFIHAAPDEEDHSGALRYIEQARTREPESPLIALVHADLLFDVGRLKESAAVATRVEQSLRGRSGYLEELRRYAAYRVASCAWRRHDPLGALARVEEALAAAPPESAGERKRWLNLLVGAARESGDVGRAAVWLDRLPLKPQEADTWRRRLRAGDDDTAARARAEALHLAARGHDEEALGRLRDLLRDRPADHRLRYDVGRMLQQARRFEEAHPHLLEAAQHGPPEVSGWAWIRLGWEDEEHGRREAALQRYARAAAMRRFMFQPAARLRMARAAEGPPEG
jgi:tetratricopeptide (TPR) repeat protein